MAYWRDWEAGMENLLMLHDDTNPPQQYLLQVINTYSPEAVTTITDEILLRKYSVQVLLSSERCKQESEHLLSNHGDIIRNGLSVSAIPNWDMVTALHICKALPEIQHWIDRCRGRPWPPAQLLEAARVAPSFLVPAGHPDIDY
ncbi:hypothetical protein DPMN_183276 [Dreissena polymorpha]|uniref:Uncharacterized protein n=1 Tax=Dreissena polymorpha TaxID=45954 RepID=A0A9D4DGV7_DREPO|nr:hypothetical protein DPMN_183276 [Dreissena polymorpha]